MRDDLVLVAKLVALAIGVVPYVALNVAVAWQLLRHLPKATRALGRRGARQLRGFSNESLWLNSGAQIVAFLLLWRCLTASQDLFFVALELAAYVLVVCTLIMSWWVRLPVVRRIATSPAYRFLAAGVSIGVVYLARGYASMWVGEVVGVSAVDTPFALFAATAQVVALCVAIVLSVMALCFEFALAFTPSVLGSWRRSSRGPAVMVLVMTSFFASIVGSRAAFELSGNRLGAALISAIAFEFDASPATPCALSAKERRLADRNEPFVRALHLATSQEKALLLMREPALFRRFALHGLTVEEAGAKRVKPLRTVACFSTG